MDKNRENTPAKKTLNPDNGNSKKEKIKKGGKHPFIDTKPMIKDNPLDRDPAPDPIHEALNIARRRKLAQQMIRMARKLMIARKIARAKFAPDKRLKVRSGKMARNIFRKRLAGSRGKNYKDLSPADKMAIDKILDKNNPRVRKLAKRLFPVVKKAEGIRLQKMRSTPKNKQVSMVKEDFEVLVLSEALLEANQDKLDVLLKAGLADQQSLNMYRKAMNNLENSLKYVQYRNKVMKVVERLVDVVTKNDSVFNKVKQDLQSKKRKSLKEESTLKRKSEESGIPFEIVSEVYKRGISSWKEGMQYTPEQYGFARVNSFISGGKARTLDKDLSEACGCEVTKKKNKTKDMVKEEGGAGKMGTPELTKKYAADTPGQESTIHLLKKIMKENSEVRQIKKDASEKVREIKAKKDAVQKIATAKRDLERARETNDNERS